MTRNNVRQLFTATEQTVNHETGEVSRSTTTSVSRAPQEPAYVKVYIDNVASMEGLLSSQKTVLYELILLLTYDGSIQITAMKRKAIIEKLGISEKTFRNNMTAIVKSGLLIRHSPSDYEANPNYFARGSWREILERREEFELRIKYKANGDRVIETGRSEDLDHVEYTDTDKDRTSSPR